MLSPSAGSVRVESSAPWPHRPRLLLGQTLRDSSPPSASANFPAVNWKKEPQGCGSACTTSPRVSDITSTFSSLDQTSTLGCEITDFYPANISVTWLKLWEGEHDDREEEVLEGGEVWGPIETHPRCYRATAILNRRPTNQEKNDKRGGIICRVEHCSLPDPVEKHWRNAEIGSYHQLLPGLGL
uniref:Ig-like domain-containing protein n=1 Tax=Gouania willdenowi TaxID=441366 RepID=A0A8C5E887_GOUWI